MSRIFFDRKHYPHGFGRSGDYTIKEAQRLEQCGFLFLEMVTGKKAPANKAEKNLYDQLMGVIPVTSPEVEVWNKYQKKISTPTRYFPLCSTTRDTKEPGESAKEVDIEADVPDVVDEEVDDTGMDEEVNDEDENEPEMEE